MYYNWYLNGRFFLLIPKGGNGTTHTITGASNGDLYKCRVYNFESDYSHDSAVTTIYVEYG